MKQMTSEDEFRKWVLSAFATVGHIQAHEDRNSVGIPDLSIGYHTNDFWLELKYGEFTVDRKYDKFEYRETTRQQLEWLRLRELTGAAVCGILGYFRVKPALYTHYVSFMPAPDYLHHCWRNEGKMDTGAAILSPYTVNAEDVRTPDDLIDFILRARVEGGLATI